MINEGDGLGKERETREKRSRKTDRTKTRKKQIWNRVQDSAAEYFA
jgi:hypothetical protein